MQTSLHIITLVAELKREIIGGRIVATEFYKKERAAYIFIKRDRGRMALGFLYHPAGAGTFLVPASKIRIETREKPWPVFNLEGAIITDIEQVGFDRIINLTTTKENTISHVLFEALGPNGNIWLLDETRCIQATLRKKKYEPDTSYNAPPLPDKLNPLTLTVESLANCLAETSSHSLAAFLEKNILGLNRTLAREIVARVGIDIEETGSPDRAALVEIVKTVNEILSRFRNPGIGYLYDYHGVPEAYPFKLSGAESLPKKFKMLSLAVMAMCSMRRSGIETVDHKKTTKDAVKRAVKRLERRLAGVEQDLKEASDYERYRKVAELLQISFNIIKKGMTEIVVTDIYTDPPVDMTIALDPALTPNENIEVYFKKHRKGRDGHK
ncbi:MAG: NFACT family protein, partial [candidate division Zixibacteria bacterium]|nr:NFACT family protein [candidate division Zixibacteria bacterium]